MDYNFKITTFSNNPPINWNQLVCNCPWGSFYHSTCNLEILSTVSSTNIKFITCCNKDKVWGGVAYGVHDGPMGPTVNCLPYFGSYGDPLMAQESPPETEQFIYRKLLSECKKIDALCLTVITSPFANPHHHETVQKHLLPHFIDERCCQIVTLPAYAGESKESYKNKVFSIIEGRARTAYRKIIRNSFELRNIQTESEAREFAEIHKANITSKDGQYKTEDFFLKVFELSKNHPKDAEISIMLDNNKIIAGVVIFYFKDTVEYHTVCLRDEYRSIGPLNRIIIEKMVDAGMSGYKRWNFGGTWKAQEGVYRFKQSFGAQDYPYYYYTTFFRDVEKIKRLTPQEITKLYPYFYVIPFSELGK